MTPKSWCLQHKGLFLSYVNNFCHGSASALLHHSGTQSEGAIILGLALAKGYWFHDRKKSHWQNHKMEFKTSAQTRNMSPPLTFYWSRKAKCPNLMSTKGKYNPLTEGTLVKKGNKFFLTIEQSTTVPYQYKVLSNWQ